MSELLNTNSATSRKAVALAGIASFAIGAFACIWVLGSDNPISTVCFVGYCPENKPAKRVIVKQSVVVFYTLLLVVSLIIYGFRKNRQLYNLLNVVPVISVKERFFWIFPLSVSEIIIWGTIIAYSIWKVAIWSVLQFGSGPRVNETNLAFILRGTVHWTGGLIDALIGLIMIPASKNSVLTTHLGIPYETGIKFHKQAGILMFYATVLHAVSYLIPLFSRGLKLGFEIIFVIDRPHTMRNFMLLFGVIALVAFLVAAIPAYHTFRQKNFNTFYYLHFFMLVMIVFAMLHSSTCIYFAIPGCLMYVADIAIRIYGRLYVHHPRIISIYKEPVGYYMLTIETPKKFDYLPGQYVWLCIPAISKFEYHPFSLCGQVGTNTLELLIQPMGNTKEWTSKAVEYLVDSKNGAQSPVSGQTSNAISLLPSQSRNPNVVIEGPFGNWLYDISGQDVIVCVATGSGIAPIIGIARQLKKFKLDRMPQIIVFWSVRDDRAEDCKFVRELNGGFNGNVVFHIFNTKTKRRRPSDVTYYPSQQNLAADSSMVQGAAMSYYARHQLQNQSNGDVTTVSTAIAIESEPDIGVPTDDSPEDEQQFYVHSKKFAENRGIRERNQAIGVPLAAASREDMAGSHGTTTSGYSSHSIADSEVSELLLYDELGNPIKSKDYYLDGSRTVLPSQRQVWGGAGMDEEGIVPVGGRPEGANIYSKFTSRAREEQQHGKYQHVSSEVESEGSENETLGGNVGDAVTEAHDTHSNKTNIKSNVKDKQVITEVQIDKSNTITTRDFEQNRRRGLSSMPRQTSESGIANSGDEVNGSTESLSLTPPDVRTTPRRQSFKLKDLSHLNNRGDGPSVDIQKFYDGGEGSGSRLGGEYNSGGNEVEDEDKFNRVSKRDTRKVIKPFIHYRRMELKSDLRSILTPLLGLHKTARIGVFICANDSLQLQVRKTVNSINQVYPDAVFDIHSESYGF